MSESKVMSTPALVVLHLLPGLVLFGLYVLIAPMFQAAGLPTMGALLLLEVVFLAPFVAWKLSRVARAEAGTSNPLAALGFAPPAKWLSYLWLVPLGAVAAIVAFEVLKAVEAPWNAQVVAWLPDWHFSNDMPRHGAEVLIPLFLIAIVADGLIGPIAEELYFRGYLLPRMQHLRWMAPTLNGLLFAIYHFWQPMNYLALCGASLVFAWLGWWRRDYRVPLLVHCTMNTLGHTLAVLSMLG